MKSQLKNAAKAALKALDVGIAKRSRLQLLEQNEHDVAALMALPAEKLAALLTPLSSLILESKSQLRQDLFVLSELNFQKGGYFVELGATNGVDFSNTYLLEKRFGWSGIVAEPAKGWHAALRQNRACQIETDCVWRDSTSTLSFHEVDIPELSTIVGYEGSDEHAAERKNGRQYEVKAVSLNDLLAKHRAPAEIDYLSIDTEGSEFEILSRLDFDKYRFKVITCDHNYTPVRQKIFDLLSAHGYVRKYNGFSRWDDWYTRGGRGGR